MPAVPAIAAEELRLSVAPMLDWTDRHCRNFHRLLAPSARLYSEMLHANAVIHGDPARWLAFDASQHPVALQLGGSDPTLLAQAARIGVAHGYDEINLNCGCPSERVQSGSFGACLMREPALVGDCVAAMRDAVAVPVTVKCRLGVDDDAEWSTFRRFIDTVAAAGCGMFVVHARNAWLKGLSPKENRDIPPLRHDWVRRLKQERPDLQIVLNGGLQDAAHAQSELAGVDGVMLGRAAYHTPYELHRLDAALCGTALESRAALLQGWQPYVQEQLQAGVPLQALVRHVLGLFHAQPGGRRFRQILSEQAHRPGADWGVVAAALDATGVAG